MTQCNPCSRMKPLSRCMAVLTIGTIAALNTAVYVYILNHTTGVRVRFPATSNAITGLVTVDLTDYPQIQGHDYEVYVTLASATNADERLTVTISTVEYTCFAVSFVTVLDDQGQIETGANQALEAI